MPKPKKYTAENNYDTSIICTVCGAAIHENMLELISKDKVRCPRCKSVFVPSSADVR